MKTIHSLLLIFLISFSFSCGSDVPVTYVESTGNETSTFARLTIEGMMCERACGTKIAKELQSIPGVLTASVNFEDGRLDNYATVTWDEKMTSPEAMADVVNGIADGKLYKVKGIEVTKPKSKETSLRMGSVSDDENQVSDQLPLLKIFWFLEKLISRPQ